jgi:hypothetical protein
MFQHSINAASFFSVLIAALTFSFSVAGVAAAQDQNTTLGAGALQNNTTGVNNTAIGVQTLLINSTGSVNTAIGIQALIQNTTGDLNTGIGNNALGGNLTGSLNSAIGNAADVGAPDLNNATAIGAGARVDASNKIRLGDPNVTVIEGQVAFSYISEKTQKENFQPVDGEEVLRKIRGFELTAGTLSATILRSFATMVRWRKTSLRPSAMMESDRSARRPRLILATSREF